MKYNKLVRDHIPQIIKESGKTPITETLDNADYHIKLGEKLVEEAEEYLNTGKVEELADLVEVIYAILAHADISWEKFEKIRLEKLHQRGGFKDRILLKKVRS